MRIQHNIMAMNAYRNYNSNASALSKNLEKLSSGYKINRAGDDAAGLAISEKMRAQISGLEAATKNVKDGISLVKTAEGAMQEIQDMLNRMEYLATQSANGTYDNEVDRANLQKEVTALCDEIDRIADSANFNGIKLMDGSLDADGEISNTTTIFSGLKASTNMNGTAPDAATGFGGPNAKGGLKLTGASINSGAVTTADVDKSDQSVRYHQEAKGNGKTSFTVDLDGLNYETNAGTTISGLEFCLQAGDYQGMGTGNQLTLDGTNKLTYDVTAGNDGVTSEDIAKAIQKVIDENDGKVYLNAGGQQIEYTVTRDGDKLKFEMSNDGFDTAAANFDETNKAKNTFQGNFNFTVAYKGTASTDDAVKAFAKALDDQVVGNAATCEINEGSKSSGTIYAQAYIRFDANGSNDPTIGTNKVDDVIADGKGLQLGDEYYIFAKSDEVYNTKYADNVKVVDIRDLNNLGNGDLDGYNDLRTALTRLSVAAKDNEMFDVQVDERGTMLAINERTTYKGDANLTEKDWGLENQIRTFDSATSTTEVTKEAGESLTLQIGDTADTFNQLKVNIGDMHVSSLGIGDIDISTQDGAQAAIQKIKDAINSVSSTRGDLGAIQNRLEHTQNNLSVMTENITDAESTIRDTDIADEMTAYTKNNILLQSAQAMLAQANQVPQGVLQLLG